MNTFTYDNEIFFTSSKNFYSTTAVKTGGITVFAHGALLSPINLLEEISSSHGALHDVCRFSAATNGTVVVGAEVKLGTLRRVSAAVAHQGELVDVVDSCSALPPFVPSSSVKVLKNGKLGCALLVGDDAIIRPLFLKVAQKCNIVLSLPVDYSLEKERLLREYADEANVPVLFHSPQKTFFVTPNLN